MRSADLQRALAVTLVHAGVHVKNWFERDDKLGLLRGDEVSMAWAG